MMRRTRVWMWGILAAMTVACVGFAWFVATYYPAMGLAGLPQDAYRQVLHRVILARVNVEDRTFIGYSSMTFRLVGKGGAAYAWGVAKCRAEDGSTVLYWVTLHWDPVRKQWLRGTLQELVPAGDELYFDRHIPGQVRRACLVLEEILGVVWSQIREARSGVVAVADLPIADH